MMEQVAHPFCSEGTKFVDETDARIEVRIARSSFL
jgi:hypothetical protein